MINLQHIQDLLDEYCMILGFNTYEKHLLTFNVDNYNFQLVLSTRENVINEFIKFSFCDDLVSGKKFARTLEGLDEMIAEYQELFNELFFYTDLEYDDFYSFITK